jgi:hypothetical protein
MVLYLNVEVMITEAQHLVEVMMIAQVPKTLCSLGCDHERSAVGPGMDPIRCCGHDRLLWQPGAGQPTCLTAPSILR